METIQEEYKVRRITGAVISHIIKKTVGKLGKAMLRFVPGDMGTQSNKPEVAIVMYLAKVPVFTIIIICRWLSDKFILFIIKQVQ